MAADRWRGSERDRMSREAGGAERLLLGSVANPRTRILSSIDQLNATSYNRTIRRMNCVPSTRTRAR